MAERRCTICMWEGVDQPAAYNAIAPTGTLHGLCDRHELMWRHRYKGILTLGQQVRMDNAARKRMHERENIR